MTTTTTTEVCEYDEKGNLVKRTTTTVTQDYPHNQRWPAPGPMPTPQPIYVGDVPPLWQSPWTVTCHQGVDTSGKDYVLINGVN